MNLKNSGVKMKPKPPLKVIDVAEQLNIDRQSVYKLCDSGDLKFIDLSPKSKHKRIRIKQEWVDEFIERQTVDNSEPKQKTKPIKIRKPKKGKRIKCAVMEY